MYKYQQLGELLNLGQIFDGLPWERRQVILPKSQTKTVIKALSRFFFFFLIYPNFGYAETIRKIALRFYRLLIVDFSGAFSLATYQPIKSSRFPSNC